MALLLVCTALSLAQAAHAEPSAVEISAAKHAFEAALGAEAEQRWADAGTKLREAIAVKDTPGLRFHLAHCETELGHLVEASVEYDRALELLQAGAKAPDVQKLLAPARAELLKRIPHLSLEIQSDVKVPVISIDKRPYTASELALGVPLNPGAHQVRVQAAGRRTFERSLTLKEGDRIMLPVALEGASTPEVPLDTSPAPEPALEQRSSAAEKTRTGDASPTKLYLMIGESVLVAAGLGVGIGYSVARGAATERINDAQARIDEVSPGADACHTTDSQLAGACSDLHAALDDHDRAALLSRIGFVTAGVGAAALVTTWLVFPRPRARASGFSVLPIVGLGRFGVIGRF